jgi:predicted nuclease of predicted toxin-antitoxin system
MRFLVDMNLSPAWVPFLRDAGLEAVHWSEVGAANASDRELMDWADAHDHIVLTSDLDFSAILAATRRQRPSVVLVRSDLLTTAAIGGAVTRAIEQTQRDLADGAVVSVDPTRARVRILPLRPER